MAKFVIFNGPFEVFDEDNLGTDVEVRLANLLDEKGIYATAIQFEEGADGGPNGFSIRQPVIDTARAVEEL